MATIGIDLNRTIGTVDRRIFGNFIEHIGRCIYGGIFEEGSPLSDERGFRRDVLDAVRPLRIPILRWPGGNFVSGYHWLDGVGPLADRPRRSELAWYAEESNRFGTDEFIQYCRAVGTEPHICVNMGTGTMDEAQAWVEYCNGTGNTSWANLRRTHGHPEPYRVRYWGLGNEMHGGWQIGSLSAEDYVKKAKTFALVMRRTDPSIELIGCGHNRVSDWDVTVIQGLAPVIDYYSIHLYTGQPDHYANVFSAHQAERAVRLCGASSSGCATPSASPIPFTSPSTNGMSGIASGSTRIAWAGWKSSSTSPTPSPWPPISMASSGSAGPSSSRTSPSSSTPSAPSSRASRDCSSRPSTHPLRLYAEHTLDTALDVYVDGPTYDLPPEREDPVRGRVHHVSDLGPFSLLDATATCDRTCGHAHPGRGESRQGSEPPGHHRPRRSRGGRRPSGLGGHRSRCGRHEFIRAAQRGGSPGRGRWTYRAASSTTSSPHAR